MPNTILKCHCGEMKELDYKTSNMGDVAKEGWGVCPTFNGELLKICPKCYEEVVFHATKIHDLTGSKYVSISHLIRR